MKAQYYMLFHLLPQLTHAKLLFFNTRNSFWRWLTLLPVMGQFQLLGLLLVGVDQELSQQLALLAQVQVPDFLLLSAVRVDHLWPLFCVLCHNLLDLCRGKGMVIGDRSVWRGPGSHSERPVGSEVQYTGPTPTDRSPMQNQACIAPRLLWGLLFC